MDLPVVDLVSDDGNIQIIFKQELQRQLCSCRDEVNVYPRIDLPILSYDPGQPVIDRITLGNDLQAAQWSTFVMRDILLQGLQFQQNLPGNWQEAPTLF